MNSATHSKATPWATVWLACWIAVAGYLLAPRWAAPASAPPSAPVTAEPSPFTVPIESIRVGERVLARNPEISDEVRSHWEDPDAAEWACVDVRLPKRDGSQLAIRLLRPRDWLRLQIGFQIAEPDTASTATSWLSAGSAESDSAERLVREVQQAAAEVRAGGLELTAVTLDIDLPEMGVAGLGVIQGIEPCPELASGPGQLVTATFHHTSGDVLDLVLQGSRSGESEESLGVTAEHPFWSVDRGGFVEAGELAPGERVAAFAGEKTVVSRLPRPGPQAVFNLEVFGEHVYFVGQDGALVHNSYIKRAIKRRDAQRSNGQVAHIDPTKNRLTTSPRSMLHGDHILPQNRITKMVARREAQIGRSLTPREIRQVRKLMNGKENLRPMLGNFNSSKGDLLAASWRRTLAGPNSKVGPVHIDYLRDLARTQLSVHRQMRALLKTFN